MADDCGCSADEELIKELPGYRRALWIVVALNVGYVSLNSSAVISQTLRRSKLTRSIF